MQTNPRDAVQDMAKALKAVFKKYSLRSRKEAWEKITTGQGRREMEILLVHPDKPTNRLKMLHFTEWVRQRRP